MQKEGKERIPKAVYSEPDYFKVIVTGNKTPAGKKGYCVPSKLYDGTRLSMMLWLDRLSEMFASDRDKACFMDSLVPGVSLEVFGNLACYNNELELSVNRFRGRVTSNG